MNRHHQQQQQHQKQLELVVVVVVVVELAKVLKSCEIMVLQGESARGIAVKGSRSREY